jgi:hypothetical protein
MKGRVLSEQLTVAKLFKKFRALYGTRNFIRLLFVYLLPREFICQTVAYQRTTALAPIFRLSGVMSQYNTTLILNIFFSNIVNQLQ